MTAARTQAVRDRLVALAKEDTQKDIDNFDVAYSPRSQLQDSKTTGCWESCKKGFYFFFRSKARQNEEINNAKASQAARAPGYRAISVTSSVC
jgi:hypothetical protein